MIEIIPGAEAYGSLTKVSRWPIPMRDKARYLPFPVVAHTPGFAIGTNDKLFTIGSCFAREVERALINLGMPVLSSFVDGLGAGENITNKYTSRSILSDLRVAFRGQNPDDTIYRLNSGSHINLAFGGHGAKRVDYTAERIKDVTRRYLDTLRLLKQTNVVVLTLGLVETWFDKERGVYLNLSPVPEMVKGAPDRFELHVLDYEEIVQDVEEILAILREECQPGVRFLCTVSPVPLATTFRRQDCLQADMYSKSVQRAAIERIHTRHADVAYFPSFEFVRLAAPDQAWIENDYRHVRPDMVARIMKTVIDGYVPEKERAPTREALAASKVAPAQLVKLVEEYLKRSGVPTEVVPIYICWYYGRALAMCRREDEAVPFLKRFVRKKPKHTASAALLGRIMAESAPAAPRSIVARIMKTVIDGHVPEKQRAPTREALAASKPTPDQLVKLVEEYLKRSGVPTEVVPLYICWYYGRALAMCHREEEAVPFLKRFVRKKPKHTASAALLGRITAGSAPAASHRASGSPSLN